MSSTIAAALIRSTFSKIHGDMSQLEHWLLSLNPETTPPTSAAGSVASPMNSELSLQVRRLAEAVEVQ